MLDIAAAAKEVEVSSVGVDATTAGVVVTAAEGIGVISEGAVVIVVMAGLEGGFLTSGNGEWESGGGGV